MSQAGVALRRGQGQASRTKISAFACLVTLAGLGVSLAWVVVHQTQSLHKLILEDDETAQARNLLEVTPAGTSLVECRVRTPYNLMDPRSNGVLTITVRHDLAPSASQAFLTLVKEGHFDGNFIFRVIAGVFAQWGIRHREIERKAGERPHDLKQRDPLTPHSLSNTRGTLGFNDATGRNKQVFVNLKDNVHLDSSDLPFATVDEAGMKLLDNLYGGYKDGMGQVKAITQGLDAIHSEFPKWSQIEKCRVVAENNIQNSGTGTGKGTGTTQ